MKPLPGLTESQSTHVMRLHRKGLHGLSHDKAELYRECNRLRRENRGNVAELRAIARYQDESEGELIDHYMSGPSEAD